MERIFFSLVRADNDNFREGVIGIVLPVAIVVIADISFEALALHKAWDTSVEHFEKVAFDIPCTFFDGKVRIGRGQDKVLHASEFGFG